MISQIVKPWEELKKIEKEKGGKDDEANGLEGNAMFLLTR